MDPSNEYCANKQQGSKPPQETTSLFSSEPEIKLTNKQTNKQTNNHLTALCQGEQRVTNKTIPTIAPMRKSDSNHFKDTFNLEHEQEVTKLAAAADTVTVAPPRMGFTNKQTILK